MSECVACCVRACGINVLVRSLGRAGEEGKGISVCVCVCVEDTPVTDPSPARDLWCRAPLLIFLSLARLPARFPPIQLRPKRWLIICLRPSPLSAFLTVNHSCNNRNRFFKILQLPTWVNVGPRRAGPH